MRGWFLRRKFDKNQKGFSLIEMVIAIPLIALSGGFVVTIIAQSFSIVNDNQTINKAGVEIQSVMDEAKNSKTCYELNQLKNDREIKKNLSSTSPVDFTVRTKVSSCATYGSNSKNQLITIESEAKSGTTDTGKVLFNNKTSVLISG